jgi:hypothetical protein
MGCAKQQFAPHRLELLMSVLTRWFLWPPGFLPGRAAAATSSASSRPESPGAVETPATNVVGNTRAQPAAGSPSLEERRAHALRSMFPMLFSMYARRSDLWRAIAIERHLAQATNIADLEQRIHEVRRQRHFSWSE